MLIPSERPTLISFFTGSPSPDGGTSTVALPSLKATRRSGISSTSAFSRTTMSALAEYPARSTTAFPGCRVISTSNSVAPSAVLDLGAIL